MNHGTQARETIAAQATAKTPRIRLELTLNFDDGPLTTAVPAMCGPSSKLYDFKHRKREHQCAPLH